jgi:hypothetical protein
VCIDFHLGCTDKNQSEVIHDTLLLSDIKLLWIFACKYLKFCPIEWRIVCYRKIFENAGGTHLCTASANVSQMDAVWNMAGIVCELYTKYQTVKTTHMHNHGMEMNKKWKWKILNRLDRRNELSYIICSFQPSPQSAQKPVKRKILIYIMEMA